MNNLKINHLAVWVMVVVLSGLGFLWYGVLFEKPWMSLTGADPDVPPGTGAWITNFVATVVPMYALAWLFTKLSVESALQGAMIGFIIAFSFVLLSRMTSDMFAQSPYALSWITGGFDMVSLTLAGAVFGIWRKYAN